MSVAVACDVGPPGAMSAIFATSTPPLTMDSVPVGAATGEPVARTVSANVPAAPGTGSRSPLRDA
jgi:sorbitol-specific phosphotransferase system component IIBC